MPWRDWQFWVVTVLAAWGAWMVVRPFLPRRLRRGGGDSCASGAASSRPKRVRLRIDAPRVRSKGATDESSSPASRH